MMLRGAWCMQITDVSIKLVGGCAERLLVFCSITIDSGFVVRDLKLIDGPSGPFIAMPSRKLSSHCGTCRTKNPLRSNYCNQCGARLAGPDAAARPDDGRQRLYADIAHPINAACRDLIQKRVMVEYEAELVRAREPGYVSRYDAVGDEEAAR